MSLKDTDVIGGNFNDAKYDRQLRLWGKEGQQTLSKSHVVALGATAVMTETLKNIILTGIHAVTVVDERVVDAEQIATSFFLEHVDMQQLTARAVAQHLCELNPDCVGWAVIAKPAAWVEVFADLAASETAVCASFGMQTAEQAKHAALSYTCAIKKAGCAVHMVTQTDPDLNRCNGVSAIMNFPTLILASNRYHDFSSISKLVCASKLLDVAVLCVECKGLVGFIQPYLSDRVIVHTHAQTEGAMEDLRIFDPFPELQAWFDAHDPMSVAMFPPSTPDNLTAHSHLPYICILYHAFKRWRGRDYGTNSEQHSCRLPSTDADYAAIREEVDCMIRRRDPPQEGFVEALKKCNPGLNRPRLTCPPSSLRLLFEDPRCSDPLLAAAELPPPLCNSVCAWQSHNVLIWFVVQAVHTFFEASIAQKQQEMLGVADSPPTRGVLPFCGHVPDFTTTSQWYSELCAIYHAKCAADVQRVTELAVVEWCRRQQDYRSISSSQHLPDDQFSSCESYTAPLLPKLCPREEAAAREVLRRLAKDVVENVWTVCLVKFSSSYTVAEAAVVEDPTLPPITLKARELGDSALLFSLIEPRIREEAWQRRLTTIIRTTLEHINEISLVVERHAACFGIALLAAHEIVRSTNLLLGDVESREDSCLPIIDSPLKSLEKNVLSSSQVFTMLKKMASLREIAPKFPAAGKPSEAPCETSALPPSWGKLEKMLQQICWEVERPGSSEVVAAAAVIGAVASQEAVKLIQRRRIPIVYPLVYNGNDNYLFVFAS